MVFTNPCRMRYALRHLHTVGSFLATLAVPKIMPTVFLSSLQSFWLCPETWGIDPLRHRFKILVNMSRLARSQVEKAFFRNAAGNVQRVWQRPAGGDAAKPSKPARGKGGASWLRNQAALKHQETASMPSPVWTANRPNAESLKAYAACPSSPNTIRPLILNKGCLG